MPSKALIVKALIAIAILALFSGFLFRRFAGFMVIKDHLRASQPNGLAPKRQTGIEVSYEDAVLLKPSEPAYSQSHEPLSAFAPRMGTSNLDKEAKGSSQMSARDVAEGLVHAKEQIGLAGSFRVGEMRGFVYIAPRDTAFSLLDTEIRLQAQDHLSGLEIFGRIAESLQGAAGVELCVGNAPFNMLQRRSLSVKGTTGSARSALVDAFEGMGFKPGDIAWDLRYDKNAKAYALSFKVSPEASSDMLRDFASKHVDEKCVGGGLTETSAFNGWYHDGREDNARFIGQLSIAGLEECWVTEGPVGSAQNTNDGCYFAESKLPKITDQNAISGGLWEVENGNVYSDDQIGFSCKTDLYYRQAGRPRCQISFDQTMSILSRGSWVKYQVNRITIDINPAIGGGTTVTRGNAVSPTHAPS